MRVFALTLGTCLLLTSFVARGQSDAKLTFLNRQLEQAKDPRARAQAALLLGQTEEPLVRAALCQAATDSSELVRAAVAQALATLAEPDGLGCLDSLALDAHADVRAAASSARARLEAERNRPTRYYVSLLRPQVDSPLANELANLADARMRRALRLRGGRLAPSQEKAAEARRVIRSASLKGFALRPSLRSLPQGGVELKILCLTYPEQAIRGEVRVKASGASEAELVRALAERAVSETAETLEWMP
ncbi:MAG: HEAT repeat domain-containing protein [Myxococcaceae bacterium]